MNSGALSRVFHLLSSTSVTSILVIVGYFAGNWLLNDLYKIAWPWFYVGFPPALAGVSLFVWFFARHRLKLYGYLLLLSVSWITSLSIGNITGGFIQALQGLLPYYANPWVLAYWIDYFVILAGLVFAQGKIGTLKARWQHKWFT